MDFSGGNLAHISLHYIGNKLNEETCIFSRDEFELNDELGFQLKDYFLERFVNVHEKHQFQHTTSLKYNVVYNFIKEIFNEGISLHDASIEIAKILYENSTHPKIKGGELYICHFTDCEYEGNIMDAVGIFKTENKNGFFEIAHQKNKVDIAYKEGIDIHKLDKGCLVFNTQSEEGFDVCIIDQQNRGDEAAYWREHFLNLKIKNTNYNQTNDFLGITKQFVTKQFIEEFEVTKTDQIDLLNRSVDYFKKHESFNKNEFEKEVLQDKGIIESFRAFDEVYRQDHDIELNESFPISAPAVKKQARVFKSVLKLDKNFHIYIHGNKDMIEQGVEKDGRKYYKIYFEKEL